MTADVISLSDLDALDQIAERPSVIKRLRDHHHLMARLCAEGKRTSEIAAETGMSLSRVSILKGDPAFRQLVEMYKINYNQLRDAAYYDVQKKYALLEANSLDHINERYEDEPENISHEQARADAEFASDRMGRKVNKSVSLTGSIPQPLAERLEEQRLRADRLSATALPVAKESGVEVLSPPPTQDSQEEK